MTTTERTPRPTPRATSGTRDAVIRALHRQRPAGEHRREALALELLHDEVERPLRGAAEVGDVDDVLLPDGAGGDRLLLEPAHQVDVGRQLRPQDLHRHALAEHDVLGAVDGAHPALSDAGEEAIALAEHLTDERVRDERGRVDRADRAEQPCDNVAP